ncbi:hypothetical protein [Acinetobacter sp. YH12239]|uniref:hypothetical protein n=1 Tax=Acinetobacter sp. YH12239 TaxID=2601166 RepID=UPI0015D3ED22|nr:hypothetical protein [Acinetobacter sp. YH12239]
MGFVLLALVAIGFGIDTYSHAQDKDQSTQHNIEQLDAQNLNQDQLHSSEEKKSDSQVNLQPLESKK